MANLNILWKANKWSSVENRGQGWNLLMDQLHTDILTNVYPLGIYKAHKSNVYQTDKQQHLPPNPDNIKKRVNTPFDRRSTM